MCAAQTSQRRALMRVLAQKSGYFCGEFIKPLALGLNCKNGLRVAHGSSFLRVNQASNRRSLGVNRLFTLKVSQV